MYDENVRATRPTNSLKNKKFLDRASPIDQNFPHSIRTNCSFSFFERKAGANHAASSPIRVWQTVRASATRDLLAPILISRV